MLLALGVVLALAGSVVAPRAVELSQGVELAFEGEAPVTTLPHFDGTGIYAVGYQHDASTRITIPVRNDGWVPIELTSLELSDWNRPMLEIVGVEGLPVRLGRGEQVELGVHARFDNCEYYTERALDLYPEARVGYRALGIDGTTEVSFRHPMAVRSPTMLRCEERVMDRSARQRNP